MRKLIIPWIFIMVMLVGGLTFIGFYQASRYGSYRELESRLQRAAESYFGMFPGELPNTGRSSITSHTLINEGFLNNLNYEEEVCIGYVIISRRRIFYNYSAYIKCDNYATRGFNERYIEDIMFIEAS